MTASFPEYRRPEGLASFTDPPVAVVAIGLDLQGPLLRPIHIGQILDAFPWHAHVEDHPAVEEGLERFGANAVPTLEFTFSQQAPMPRVVLFGANRERLTFLQESTFHCAWRKTSVAEQYPRYSVLRQQFLEDLTAYQALVTGIHGLPPAVVGANITYTNLITIADRSPAAALRETLKVFAAADDETLAPDEEGVIFCSSRVYGGGPVSVAQARFRLKVEAALTEPTSSAALIRMELSYRGQPARERPELPPTTASVMQFIDAGHDRIVKAFAEATTSSAHQSWGREKP